MGALKGKRVGWSDSGQRFRTAIAYDLVGLLGRNVGGEGKKDGKYRPLEQFEEIWKGGSTRLSVPRRGCSFWHRRATVGTWKKDDAESQFSSWKIIKCICYNVSGSRARNGKKAAAPCVNRFQKRCSSSLECVTMFFCRDGSTSLGAARLERVEKGFKYLLEWGVPVCLK